MPVLAALVPGPALLRALAAVRTRPAASDATVRMEEARPQLAPALPGSKPERAAFAGPSFAEQEPGLGKEVGPTARRVSG